MFRPLPLALEAEVLMTPGLADLEGLGSMESRGRGDTGVRGDLLAEGQASPSPGCRFQKGLL